MIVDLHRFKKENSEEIFEAPINTLNTVSSD